MCVVPYWAYYYIDLYFDEQIESKSKRKNKRKNEITNGEIMTEKIKSVVLATGKQEFDNNEVLDYVLAFNEQWGEFVMNPRNLVNYDNNQIINFKVDMAKFIGCKRKDELVCSRAKAKKGQWLYTIEEYMTLEKIKDRFVEKEYRKETEKSSKFVKSDKTFKFIKDSISEKKAEYRAYGRFIPKGPGYFKKR